MTKTQYPKQIFSALNNTGTISVESYLVRASGKTENGKPFPPLEFFQSNFSRYKFIILSKRDGKYIPASVNLRAEETADVAVLSLIVRALDVFLRFPAISETIKTVRWTAGKIQKLEKVMTKSFSGLFYFLQHRTFPAVQDEGTQAADPSVPGNRQKACSVKFKAGNFRDMTPYDVLTAGDGEQTTVLKNLEDLTKQKEYFGERLSKYPGNKALIDAIEAALCLVVPGTGILKPGVLDVSAPTEDRSPGGLGSVQIYSSGPKGNARKRDAQTGLCPCSELQIQWNLGNDYPVEVTIKNYMAPVNEYNDGRQNTLVAQMDKNSLVINSFKLSAKQWSNLVYMMELNKIVFAVLKAEEQYNEADDIELENRQEAGQQSAAQEQMPYPQQYPYPQQQYPQMQQYPPAQYQQPQGQYPQPPMQYQQPQS